MLALSFFSTKMFATALIQAFNGHGTILILWAWSTLILCDVFHNVFSAKLRTVDPGVHIPATALAREFKFAEAVVQRL